MKLLPTVLDSLLNASAKALATTGEAGLNVVPVSSLKVVDGNIWLVDYFFGKTRTNVQTDHDVSLVFWDGLKGYQIKADSRYMTSGDEFDATCEWIGEVHPERTVIGALILEPREVHDISIDTLV